MPIIRRSSHHALSLDDIEISHQLDLLAGWFPPQYPVERARSRWRDWAHFLEEYRQVRSELLEHFAGPGEIFAERVHSFVAARGMRALLDIDSFDALQCTLDEFDAGSVSSPGSGRSA